MIATRICARASVACWFLTRISGISKETFLAEVDASPLHKFQVRLSLSYDLKLQKLSTFHLHEETASNSLYRLTKNFRTSFFQTFHYSPLTLSPSKLLACSLLPYYATTPRTEDYEESTRKDSSTRSPRRETQPARSFA